jgi:hypothetical protein
MSVIESMRVVTGAAAKRNRFMGEISLPQSAYAERTIRLV